MAGKRRPVTLREKRGAYVADIYRPDGRRTTVSFGAAKGRTVSEIHVAFSRWLDLFKEHPSKVLSFDSPYDALDSMIHPGSIQTVGRLVDNYVKWAGQYLAPLRDGRAHPDLSRADRLRRFLKPYLKWKVADFGADELGKVQDAKLLLGHVSTDTTEIYLLDEVQETVKVAKAMARDGCCRCLVRS